MVPPCASAMLEPTIRRQARIGPPCEQRDRNDQDDIQPEGKYCPDLYSKQDGHQHREEAGDPLPAHPEHLNLRGDLLWNRAGGGLGEETVDRRLEAQVHVGEQPSDEQEECHLQPQGRVSDKRPQAEPP